MGKCKLYKAATTLARFLLFVKLYSICVTMSIVPNLYSSPASGPPSPLFGKEERRLKVTFAYDTV